ncbi:hypothetical protein GOBAR_AA16717 [Gossypium barbadense]|uniref:Sialate O-acetylesterase domain-containing protein n=1 Tax=Gossypium barbadense TaxID=3634 RepID=A0A2P5XKS9_GOSBA|nr:hypothetical protein GOBAR_AA16717 [Gossypium barbadense]
MLSFIALALLAYALPIECQNLLKHKVNIIILAGQSNMAGRGGVANETSTGIGTWDGVVPPQCQPNPSIFRLSADLAWVKAREPIHADIDARKTDGVGPGMLLPMRQWQKGEFLYEQLVKRAEMAQQSGGVYRAMLWYQGEADTVNEEDVELYKGRLKTFFDNLRSDLHAPLLPIFQVILASGEGPYIEEVREAQLNIGLPNVKCVDAKGLPLEPDDLHLTTQAQVRLGEMLADAYLRFKPRSLQSNNVPTPCSNFVPFFIITAQFLWIILT